MEEGQDSCHGFARAGGSDDEAVVTFHHIGQDVNLDGRRLPPLFLQRSGKVWVKPGKDA